jgi:hypothetical protein
MIRKQKDDASKPGEVTMFKRIGIFALILSATGAALLPKAVFAQDGYYVPRDNYYQADRNGDRHEMREWRERERRDRRAEEWRERVARERDWRERDRRSNYGDRDYHRDAYSGFGHRH